MKYKNSNMMKADIFDMLDIVLGWFRQGIDVHVHCSFPLNPLVLFGMPEVVPPVCLFSICVTTSLLSFPGARCIRQRQTDDTTGPPPRLPPPPPTLPSGRGWGGIFRRPSGTCFDCPENHLSGERTIAAVCRLYNVWA